MTQNTRQNLFNYFAEQHGIKLIDSDFNEIENYIMPEMNTEIESAYNRGLSDGQTITESAIETIAIEFAEYCDYASNRVYLKARNKWTSFDDEGDSITSSELFAKFMQERSAQ